MSEIETMLGGKISPGLKKDLKTDLEIHKLNTEFKQVNFGQNITNETIDEMIPIGVTDQSVLEYRKWRQQ